VTCFTISRRPAGSGRTSASKFAWPNSSFPHRVRSRKDGATFDTDRLKSNLQALATNTKRSVEEVTRDIQSSNPVAAVRSPRGVWRRLRVPVLGARRLHHRSEHPRGWWCVSRYVLKCGAVRRLKRPTASGPKRSWAEAPINCRSSWISAARVRSAHYPPCMSENARLFGSLARHMRRSICPRALSPR
jgi:hypothetical protein